jgi:hypothetical protein
MKKVMTRIGLSCGLALMVLGPTVQASTNVFNFNTDPTGIVNFYGSAVWVSSGGCGANPATDGYLQITAAANSQRGSIVFNDFDAGSVVQAFTFEADLRIGNGTAAPADGFSLNYCRNNDPVLGVTPPEGWNTGPNCEANLPEEGTQTGIAIGFDAWNSDGNPPYCDGLGNLSTIGPDIIGIDLHVDGISIAQFPMLTQNGACNDPTSIQTGPQDGTFSNTNLCWAHLKVVLDTNAQLSIFWKGTELLTNYQTTYFPSPGRLVFAGRTGNANEFHEIDNISIITVPAALGLVGSASGFPDGFTIQVSDSGSSVVAPGSAFTLKLNGSPVVANATNKVGGTTTLIYHGFPVLQPSGSTNSVFLSCKDTNNNTISGTRTYVTPSYLAMPANGLASGVDTTQPGWRLQPWQAAGGEPNTVVWMQEQIEGYHGPNLADISFATDNGYIDFTNGMSAYFANNAGVGTNTWTNAVINFDRDVLSDGDFVTANGYMDQPFPGIPGPTLAPNCNNTAMDMLFFMKFPAGGIYTMGVNSDDGFIVNVGPNPKDRFSPICGQFNGGKGASDVLFTMAVPAAGVYRMRLAWENGGGGCNCEFFSVNPDGTKVLVNDPDPTNTTGIAAYYIGPAAPAYVSYLSPYIGQTGARPDTLRVDIRDGSTTVVPAGVTSMTLDGSSLTMSKVKSGNTTQVNGINPPTLMTPGSHVATIVYQDSASVTVTDTWSFTVAGSVIVGTNLWTAPGSAANSGLRLRVWQSPNTNLFNGYANSVPVAETGLNGIFGPDQANHANETNGGYYIIGAGGEPAVINFSQNNQGAVANNGNFGMDNAVPGLPGLVNWGTANPMDNDAYSAKAFIEFPASGFYQLGVNSDDGFRVSVGDDLTSPGRSMLGVLAPASIQGEYVAMNTSTTDNGAGFGGPLPSVPIISQAVLCDPIGANTALNNAGAIAGKVALCQGRPCNFACQSLNCFNAGAIAVIGTLAAGDGAQLPGQRGGGAAVPIPLVEVTYADGVTLVGQATTTSSSPLWVRISDVDCSQNLGQFSGGRGSSDTIFNVTIPRAGVYPMRMIWQNGGGGANSEFFSVDANGVKTLINDPSSSIKAWTTRTVANPATQINAVLNGTMLTLSWSGEGELDYSFDLGAVDNIPINGGKITQRWNKAANQNNPQTIDLTKTGVSQTFYRIRSY